MMFSRGGEIKVLSLDSFIVGGEDWARGHITDNQQCRVFERIAVLQGLC
jgi:hypothetical protein